MMIDFNGHGGLGDARVGQESDYDRGVFQGKVLADLEAIKHLGNDLNTQLRGMEKRVTTLERDYSKAKGMAIIVGGCAGALIGFIFRYLPFLK